MPDTISNLASLTLGLIADLGDPTVQASQSSASMNPWWYDTFRPFSFLHFFPAGLGLMAIAIYAALGLKASGTPREPRIRLPIAGLSLAYAIVVSIWYVVPPHLDLKKSLPLHMCDVALLIAPISMIWRPRWLRTLLFLWGVGLCSQAFITPTITVGVADLEYHFFWISHIVIVGSAVYDYVAGGYRPRFKDYLVCVGCGLVWIVSVFLINLAIEGANYGYVGNVTPKNPTIVDKLGPWPLRALYLALIAIAGCGVIFVGSRLFEYLEAREKRWPARIALSVIFTIGAAMMAAGVRDAVFSTPKPTSQPVPTTPAPSESSPDPKAVPTVPPRPSESQEPPASMPPPFGAM